MKMIGEGVLFIYFEVIRDGTVNITNVKENKDQ